MYIYYTQKKEKKKGRVEEIGFKVSSGYFNFRTAKTSIRVRSRNNPMNKAVP